jgi:hypothetical protein
MYVILAKADQSFIRHSRDLSAMAESENPVHMETFLENGIPGQAGNDNRKEVQGMANDN